MADAHDLKQRAAILDRLAMRINAKPEKSQIALLSATLAGMPLASLREACEELAKTERFWPAEAVIREAVAVIARHEAIRQEERARQRALPEVPRPEVTEEFMRKIRALCRVKGMPQ